MASSTVAKLPSNQATSCRSDTVRAFRGGVVGLVLSVAGEVEQPGTEPGFVEAFGHKLFLLYRQAHVAVACRHVESARRSTRQ